MGLNGEGNDAPRRRRGLEAALVLAAALLFGEVCSLPLELAARARVAGAPPGWLLPLDDAYIFVRYAQQAARGRPWQWNTGEPSTGASSVLWPWLLVPPHWVSGDLAVWSRWSRWLGVASLWALGLAAVRALRAARVPEPWPLAGGLCLVWSGPIGFGAAAGMESAANAALLVLACALWMESLGDGGGADARDEGDEGDEGDESEAGGGGGGGASRPSWRSARTWAPIVTAALPLARPENGALTLLGALVMLGARRRRLPWPRWTGAAVLVPGMVLAWCNWRTTGIVEPAGALAKSWLHVPFLPLGARVASYVAVLRRALLPVYVGTKPTALWPPVGLLAAGTAAAALHATVARRRAAAAAWRNPLAALAPLAAAWLVLAALAPLSILLLWQEMRHHHAGLALAWLLAFAGAGLASEALGAWRRERRAAGAGGAIQATVEEPPASTVSRWRSAPLALPLLLILAFPHWARESARGAVELWRGHGRAAAWLAAHGRRETLLLTDAGLLAIVHDGPAIDALGLCSPDLTEASLHGPGALVESLARRRPLPEIAAAEPALLHLPLLGEPLLPPVPGPAAGLAAPPGEITVLARVRRELLAGTVLDGPGLDFAYLPDERRRRLRWHPPPLPPHTSAALLLPGPGSADGATALQGCRPLFGTVEIELPPGIAEVRLRAALLPPGGDGEVVAAAGDSGGALGPPLARGRLRADRWSEVPMALPARASTLWLARRGPGVPCLESLRYVGMRPGAVSGDR
ncbi:MAG TPA: hypothetical protein VHB47_02400 [Thermoanaerobaculia bacterium]|nr:hypothetical protein [Thermoanaerobaculia bacterium]